MVTNLGKMFSNKNIEPLSGESVIVFEWNTLILELKRTLKID